MQRAAGVRLEWLSVAISVKKIKIGLGESKNIGEQYSTSLAQSACFGRGRAVL